MTDRSGRTASAYRWCAARATGSGRPPRTATTGTTPPSGTGRRSFLCSAANSKKKKNDNVAYRLLRRTGLMCVYVARSLSVHRVCTQRSSRRVRATDGRYHGGISAYRSDGLPSHHHTRPPHPSRRYPVIERAFSFPSHVKRPSTPARYCRQLPLCGVKIISPYNSRGAMTILCL